jgi:hypothetical protein
VVIRNLSILAILAVLATPNLAAASSVECDLPYDAPFVAPVSGAVDVPTNSKIWVANGDPAAPDIVLLDPDGVELVLAEESRTFASPAEDWVRQDLRIFTPESALAPDTDYKVWSCAGEQCTTMLTAFHTGPGPSSTPPAVPTVVATGPDRACEFHWVDLAVEFTGAVLVVDTVDGMYDEAGGPGLALGDTRHVFVPWPSLVNDAELRIGAYALDGSFSGWSEPIAVHHELGGCTVGAASPGSALLLLLLGLRRRRRLSASR